MPDLIKRAPHRLLISDRRLLTLNGVIDVVDFSDRCLTLNTEEGYIVIDGNNMRIENLASDSGEITVNGEFNGFYYKSDAERKSFFGKLFK